MATYPFQVTMDKVHLMQVAQAFPDVGQLVHLEGACEREDVGLTSCRRFALGWAPRYAIIFPCLISFDIIRKSLPYVDTPSSLSTLGCDSLLHITTSLQNL